VRGHLTQLLAGQTATVSAAREEAAAEPAGTATQRQVLQRTVGYSRRNLPSMRYDA